MGEAKNPALCRPGRSHHSTQWIVHTRERFWRDGARVCHDRKATQAHNVCVEVGVTPVVNGEALFTPVWELMFGN